MDTQNIHTFFSANTVGYYMSGVNKVQSNQVESFQPQSASFTTYIKNIAGQSSIVPQLSNVNDGKYLDGRDVIETALQITVDAARSINFEPENDTKVTSLFTNLAQKPNITYVANESKLHYKNLEITVSFVNGQFEANVFMRGCNDISTLKSEIKEFYAAAGMGDASKATDKHGVKRFAIDGIYFPAIDAADSELRHYYSTNDKSVVIDQYAYKAINIAFSIMQGMAPECFYKKRETYNNDAKLQSATEQQLAFTYAEIEKINEKLRELKEKSAQQDVAKFQQVDAQKDKEIEDLLVYKKALEKAFRPEQVEKLIKVNKK